MKLCGDVPSDVENLRLQGWPITHAGRAGAAGTTVNLPQLGPPGASARPAKKPAAPAPTAANAALRPLLSSSSTVTTAGEGEGAMTSGKGRVPGQPGESRA